jgi:acyl-CoA thioester hydrolase
MANSRETPAPLPPLETWRGCANAWECDEMGHMNVRHYVGKCSEGLARVAAALSMPGAFGPKAASTLRPRSQHIRFLAEARAGAPLSMHGGVVAIGESDAVIYQEMRHVDGRVAATFLTRVAHVDARTGKPFPWPQRSHAEAGAIAFETPAHGAPRSIDLDKPAPNASMARADALGAPTIGLSLVTPDMADAFGRMRIEHFVGRISDGAPNLFARWRKESGDAQGKRLGGAVLEYRLDYRRWPQAGDLVQVRSGVIELADKTQRVIHWLLDPVGGEAWATGEVIAVTFDLDARKAVAPPPEQRAFLMQQAIPELAD